MLRRPGFRRLFRLVLRPPALEQEVDEELQHHLQLRAEQLQRDEGLSPAEAWEQAQRRFGNLGKVRT